ncbi:MAG: hypothetical protein ACJ8R9_03660 [Steroidobacteraceae bacterium]
MISQRLVRRIFAADQARQVRGAVARGENSATVFCGLEAGSNGEHRIQY